MKTLLKTVKNNKSVWPVSSLLFGLVVVIGMPFSAHAQHTSIRVMRGSVAPYTTDCNVYLVSRPERSGDRTGRYGDHNPRPVTDDARRPGAYYEDRSGGRGVPYSDGFREGDGYDRDGASGGAYYLSEGDGSGNGNREAPAPDSLPLVEDSRQLQIVPVGDQDQRGDQRPSGHGVPPPMSPEQIRDVLEGLRRGSGGWGGPGTSSRRGGGYIN